MAVKIHQLNSAWHESKKASYVRHAVREYNIHKSLRHARVVGLLDIFEIDVNTFATVLELCRGRDLDAHLKDHQVSAGKAHRVAPPLTSCNAHLKDHQVIAGKAHWVVPLLLSRASGCWQAQMDQWHMRSAAGCTARLRRPV